MGWFSDLFSGKPRVRDILMGTIVGLTLYASAAQVFGKSSEKGYSYSGLNEEQITIVQKWEEERQDRKLIIKEMQELNKAKNEVEKAVEALDNNNEKLCLDHIINANGILESVKKIDTSIIKADLFKVRQNLGKFIQSKA